MILFIKIETHPLLKITDKFHSYSVLSKAFKKTIKNTMSREFHSVIFPFHFRFFPGEFTTTNLVG